MGCGASDRPDWLPLTPEDAAAAESRYIVALMERQRQEEEALYEARRREWDDLQVGRCVRLTASVTERVLGLALCSGTGEPIEMDGLLMEIDSPRRIGTVRILMACEWPGCSNRADGVPVINGTDHQVGRNEIIGISDYPPSVWRNATTAAETAARRDGRDPPRRQNEQFWEG